MSVPGRKGRRPPRYPLRAVGGSYESPEANRRGQGFAHNFRRDNRIGWPWSRKPVTVPPRKGPFRRRDRRRPTRPR